MMVEQYVDTNLQQFDEYKPTHIDEDAPLAVVDAEQQSSAPRPWPSAALGRTQQAGLAKDPRARKPEWLKALAGLCEEDFASDLSTELGSDDADECGGGVESSDVYMAPAFSMEGTLFIFDWDDTLLPSTWVMQQGLSLDEASVPSDEQFAQLQRVAECAKRTLEGALQRGRVIIITNGEQGWVELSCAKFMPSLAPVLEAIPIVSARTTYEKQGIVSPFLWKLHAFSREIYGFYAYASADLRRNVLSLGDSMHEHMALASVTLGMPKCRAKSVKFASFPELEQLVEQHELVSKRLDDIVDHDGDLSLEVSASMN